MLATLALLLSRSKSTMLDNLVAEYTITLQIDARQVGLRTQATRVMQPTCWLLSEWYFVPVLAFSPTEKLTIGIVAYPNSRLSALPPNVNRVRFEPCRNHCLSFATAHTNHCNQQPFTAYRMTMVLLLSIGESSSRWQRQ